MSMKKIVLMGATAIAALAGLAGCNGTVTVGGGGGPIDPAWYDVYGTYCGNHPGPGCNFYVDGSQILDYEDPYYASHHLEFAVWTYTDSYGYRRTYTGWAWLSNDGILYDDYGYALNELENGQSGKDLIADVAAMEQKKVAAAGKAFAAKYALAEDTGVQIARTLNDWAKLGKKRSRTEADLADFTQRLYGVSLDKAKAALSMAETGDTSNLEGLNNEVAAHWGTSAETSKAILKSFYKNQLSSIGQ